MSENEVEQTSAAPPQKPGVLKGDTGTELAMVVMCALLVVLAGFFVFAGALGNPLSGRDIDLFVSSTSLHRLVTAPAALDTLPQAPLTVLGFALNWALAPGGVGLRSGSLFLHALAAVFAYLCARRLAPKGTPEPFAMLAGLFVAVGPFAAGAVDIVAARPVIQASCFGLISLYAFLRATERDTLSPGSVVVCVAMYVAASASHCAAFALPAVILLADLAVSGPGGIRRHLPVYGALSFFLLALLVACATTTGGLELPMLTRDETYFAGVVLGLLLVAIVTRLPQPTPRLAGAVMVLLALVAGVYLAFRENGRWADPAAWLQAEAERTQTAKAWRYLADYQLSAPPADGAPSPAAQALPALQQWRVKAPENARAAALLGGALLETGKPEDALPVLLDSLSIDPWNGGVSAQVAAIYEQRARKEGRDTLALARDYYQRAYDRGALSKEQLEPFALVLAGLGDLDHASAILKQSIGDAKEGPAAAALARFDAGRKQIASREDNVNKMFAQEGGGGATAVVLRAEVEYLKGHYMQAFYLLDRLVRNEEKNEQAWSMLGLVRARLQQADAFLAEDAPRPAATGAAWDDLVKRCAASGLWDAALAYVRKSPGDNPEVRLASIAQEYRQPQRAEDFLKMAAEKAPADPLPWMRLCDLAIQAKDIARANQLLVEAQKRGASDEQLKPLRDQLGAPATPSAVPMQKIVN